MDNGLRQNRNQDIHFQGKRAGRTVPGPHYSLHPVQKMRSGRFRLQAGRIQQLHSEGVHMRQDLQLPPRRVFGRGELHGQRSLPQGRHRHEGHRGCGHHHDPLLHHLRYVPVDLQEVAEAVLVVGLRRPERVLATGLPAGRGRDSGIQSRGTDGPHAGGRGVLARRGQGSAAQLRLVVPRTE